VEYLVNRKVILALTKVDITGPVRVGEWMKYFKAIYPDLRVVQVESYIEKDVTTVHQGKKQLEPHIPHTFRHRLIEAIKEAHAEMLEPPERLTKNPEWLKKWVPPVKREIDWDSVPNADSSPEASSPKSTGEDVDEASNIDKEPEVLTVGLIGSFITFYQRVRG
jgi:hypothetical protein